MMSATELQTSSECAYQSLTKGMEMNSSWLHQQIGKNSSAERARYCHQWSWVSVWRLPGLALHQLFQPGPCSAAAFRLASKFSSLHLQTDFAAPACSCECTQQSSWFLAQALPFLGCALCLQLTAAFCSQLHFQAFSVLLPWSIHNHCLTFISREEAKNPWKIEVSDAPRDALKLWSFPRARTIFAVALELTGHFP